METRHPPILKRLYPAHGSDGVTYEVHVYVEPPDPHAGAPIEKISKLVLADGRELRVLAHRHYAIAGEDVTMHAEDPDAI